MNLKILLFFTLLIYAPPKNAPPDKRHVSKAKQGQQTVQIKKKKQSEEELLKQYNDAEDNRVLDLAKEKKKQEKENKRLNDMLDAQSATSDAKDLLNYYFSALLKLIKSQSIKGSGSLFCEALELEKSRFKSKMHTNVIRGLYVARSIMVAVNKFCPQYAAYFIIETCMQYNDSLEILLSLNNSNLVWQQDYFNCINMMLNLNVGNNTILLHQALARFIHKIDQLDILLPIDLKNKIAEKLITEYKVSPFISMSQIEQLTYYTENVDAALFIAANHLITKTLFNKAMEVLAYQAMNSTGRAEIECALKSMNTSEQIAFLLDCNKHKLYLAGYLYELIKLRDGLPYDDENTLIKALVAKKQGNKTEYEKQISLALIGYGTYVIPHEFIASVYLMHLSDMDRETFGLLMNSKTSLQSAWLYNEICGDMSKPVPDNVVKLLMLPPDMCKPGRAEKTFGTDFQFDILDEREVNTQDNDSISNSQSNAPDDNMKRDDHVYKKDCPGTEPADITITSKSAEDNLAYAKKVSDEKKPASTNNNMKEKQGNDSHALTNEGRYTGRMKPEQMLKDISKHAGVSRKNHVLRILWTDQNGEKQQTHIHIPHGRSEANALCEILRKIHSAVVQDKYSKQAINDDD